MLTRDAIVEKYSNGQIEWQIPIEWHLLGRYRFHGEATRYYPTGEVNIRKQFEHGIQIGEETIFDKSGSVMSILPFVDGKKHGTYRHFHADGRKEQQEYVSGEAVVGSIRRWDKDGNELAVKQKPEVNDADGQREPEPKKILPGDHIPPSLLR